MQKFTFSFLGLLLFLIQAVNAADASRSDSLDIRNTIIKMSITDYVSKQVQAHATLDVKAKVNNLSILHFDLEGLVVDSAKMNSIPITFSQNGQTLAFTLTTAMQLNDSALIDVYYHGVPIFDATWGGFSYVGNYAFQMGVGFNAQPHSFGRTWHPCFDNFVERSSYEFYITTTNDKKALCNGMFQDSTLLGNNLIEWHWKLEEEIPSYLASVAVANYIIISQTLNGNQSNFPAEIACEAADIAKVNGSFAHLQQSFSMLENRFGNYSWPKVGYTLVPFNAGAMEHATNIHIGRPFIDGTLNYETLIAHELAHHWWGDLVTCSTAGDMWLNEGFASYCEHLHTEAMYGIDAYISAIRANHFDVISNAHINDDGYRAIANMDSNYTYGSTVYLKGADAIHSLRTYLGDANFFDGSTAFLNANKFKHISTAQYRDFLSTFSGKNMNDFFNNWIFEPGFTNFCIDSMDIVPNGNLFDVSVFIRQRKHQSLNYYNNVPLEIGFYQNAATIQIVPFNFSGRCMQLKVSLPFSPNMTIIDPDYKLSDASTETWKTVTNTGITNMDHAKCRLHVKSLVSITDSSTVRIQHEWVAPDRFKNPINANGYVLHNNRHWKVDGMNLNNFNGWIQFPYNKTSGNGFLDSAWAKNTDDSIRLFYRKDAREEWTFANDSLVAGNLTDGIGNIYAKTVKTGEYCLGIKRSNYVDVLQTDAPANACNVVTHVNIESLKSNNDVLLFPNPNQGVLVARFAKQASQFELQIFNLLGQNIPFTTTLLNAHDLQLEIAQPQTGVYFMRFKDTTSGKIQIERMIIR